MVIHDGITETHIEKKVCHQFHCSKKYVIKFTVVLSILDFNIPTKTPPFFTMNHTIPAAYKGPNHSCSRRCWASNRLPQHWTYTTQAAAPPDHGPKSALWGQFQWETFEDFSHPSINKVPISHRIHGAGILMLTWLGYIDRIHGTLYIAPWILWVM